jgi:membrane fusion protein, heavy metal efflux system
MKQIFCTNILGLLMILSPLTGYGHVGHDHGAEEFGGGSAFGPVTIDERIERNLGLQIFEADLQPIERTLMALAHVEAMPKRTAALSSRIPGRIVSLSIEPDQYVSEGEEVMVIESLQVGSPPPRMTMTSPISGYVTRLAVTAGEGIEPGQRLAEIVNMDRLYAIGRVSAADGQQLSPGQRVRLRLEGLGDRVIEGAIESLASQFEEGTPQWRFRVPLDNSDGRMRPHMHGTLHVVVEENDMAIVVPRSAVLGEMGNYFVFSRALDDPMRYEPRPVVLGLRDDRYFEILEGVLPGDQIVMRGNYQLQFAMAGATQVTVAEAHGHEHNEGDPAHDHDHHHWWEHPLVWTGVVLGLLLLVNAFLLYFRR